jgi:hypothetical protein
LGVTEGRAEQRIEEKRNSHRCALKNMSVQCLRVLVRRRRWALVRPTFLHFSPFWFFCTIMPFVVSFKKMDPNLGAIIIGAELTQSGTDIIGANYAYVAGDRGSTP